MPAFVRSLGRSINRSQADHLLFLYRPHLLAEASRTAQTIRLGGQQVLSWTVFSADEIVRAWSHQHHVIEMAQLSYRPKHSDTVRLMHLGVDKRTGEIRILDQPGASGSGSPTGAR